MTRYLENKKEPLVSVLMSEYSTPDRILIESVKSILNQSYKNLEIILIDDSKKQNLKKRLADLSDIRLKIIQNGKNRGLVYSLNHALSIAKGTYIARMDTDDYAYVDRIQKQLDWLTKNSDYSLVGMNADLYDEKTIWGTTKYEGDITKEQLLHGSPLIHPTILAKRQDLVDMGGYPNYTRCEDYALWIKLFLNNKKMYNMKEVGVKYHLDKTDFKKRTLKTRKDFFRLINDDYKKLSPTRKQLIIIRVKTLVAGLTPPKLAFIAQKRKFKRG